MSDSKNIMAAIAVGTMLVSGCASFSGSNCTGLKEPAFDTLIAHRGESHDAPENTLPAFKMAVDRGFGFECDLYLSKDGRVFSFHDRNLKRTTGIDMKCSEASWSKTLSKLDAGAWKGDQWKGVTPALLEDILPLARKNRKIYLEIKTGPEIVPYIKEILSKQSWADPSTALFICFSKDVCAELNRALPEYKTYWLCGRLRRTEGKTKIELTAADIIRTLKEAGADGVDIYYDRKLITADFISQIKAAGFELHVWTVDDMSVACEAFERGALTVTTNRAKGIYDEYQASK